MVSCRQEKEDGPISLRYNEQHMEKRSLRFRYQATVVCACVLCMCTCMRACVRTCVNKLSRFKALFLHRIFYIRYMHKQNKPQPLAVMFFFSWTIMNFTITLKDQTRNIFAEFLLM